MGKLRFPYEENDERNRIMNKIHCSDIPIAIYGTGKFAVSIAKRILETGKEFFFIDPAQYYYDEKKIEVFGKLFEVISETQMKKFPERFLLLSGLIDYGIIDTLKKKIPNCDSVEYLDVYPPHIMKKSFVEENIYSLESIYVSLSDDESKDVLQAWLDARITGNVRNLVKLVHSNKWNYDWNLLKLNEDDVIVDGGAYIGDTVEEIERFMGIECKKIYAFEPDAKNFAILKNKYAKRKNIICLNAGIYNKDGEVSFSGGGTLGSSIVSEGGDCITVKALDSEPVFADTSIIKLDVEGSELQALKGARNIIEKNIPNLAICIYHNNRDIIDVWDFLHKSSTFNKYKFYLRQHSRSVEETVLYAVQL